jgi:hypothetical protein
VWLGYRVAGEEAGEAAGYGGGVLRVQEMGEAGQVECSALGSQCSSSFCRSAKMAGLAVPERRAQAAGCGGRRLR